MRKIKASDYKGKWFVLMDEDKFGDFDYERKEINVDYVMNEGLAEHVENCAYYGIPCYVGENKELLKRIDELEKLLTNPLN